MRNKIQGQKIGMRNTGTENRDEEYKDKTENIGGRE